MSKEIIRDLQSDAMDSPAEENWKEVEAGIKCPFKPGSCRKDQGIKRVEEFLSHSAVIITAECNFCGSKASGWGER